MANGHGFGKIILFGEHFVVHGLSGIVIAIDRKFKVRVERDESLKSHTLIDQSPKFPGVPLLTWEICQKPLTKILDLLHIKTPLKITFHGDLPVPNSGIGSSAACIVAFIRAISAEFGLNLSDEKVNELAYEGEKEIHGNPSGIDNTAATYGGVFMYKKGEALDTTPSAPLGANGLKSPLQLVIVESGVKTDTKTVIEAVKTLKDQKPKMVKEIFKKYEELVKNAYKALTRDDLPTVGRLMDENHELLQKLTVSCPEQDKIVQIARKAGALGAKITGTGRGGLCVALTPDKKTQKKVANALTKAGYANLTQGSPFTGF